MKAAQLAILTDGALLVSSKSTSCFDIRVNFMYFSNTTSVAAPTFQLICFLLYLEVSSYYESPSLLMSLHRQCSIAKCS
jgi:hypothetical protein